MSFYSVFFHNDQFATLQVVLSLCPLFGVLSQWRESIFATRMLFMAVALCCILCVRDPSLVILFLNSADSSLFHLEPWRIALYPFVNNQHLHGVSIFWMVDVFRKAEKMYGSIMVIILFYTMVIATGLLYLLLSILPFIFWGNESHLRQGLGGIVPVAMAMAAFVGGCNIDWIIPRNPNDYFLYLSRCYISNIVLQSNIKTTTLGVTVGIILKYSGLGNYVARIVRRWEVTSTNRILVWVVSCDGFGSILASHKYGTGHGDNATLPR